MSKTFNQGDHVQVTLLGVYHGAWGVVDNLDQGVGNMIPVRLDAWGVGIVQFAPEELENFGPSKVEEKLDKQDEEDDA